MHNISILSLVRALFRLGQIGLKSITTYLESFLPHSTSSPTEKSNISSQSSVFRSALAMATGTLSSRILGLLRDVLLAAFFPKMVTDTFFAAFKLPNMFRRLLGEGSLSVSFIPVYIDLQHRHGQEKAQKLSGSLWGLLLIITGLLSLVGVLFMDKLLPLLLGGEGFVQVPGKLALAIALAKIMFSYLFLVTSYAFLMAVANAHKYFFIPAMGPTVFNFTFIVSSLLSYYFGVLSGQWIAIGVLVGGALQTLLVKCFLITKKIFPKPSINLKVQGLALTLRNMLPGMLGLGVVQLMSLVNLRFASQLPEGAISYIYYGDRILELPQSLIAISLGSALLPTLSKLWSQGQKSLFLQESLKYQKILLFLALPCCAGLYVLAEPIVQVLFQRGEFNSTDVAGTVVVLQVYSFLLLASGFNKILVPNLYAIKNTWLPATITVFSLSLHIFMAPHFLKEMGLRGLVLSMTLSGFANMFLILLSCHFLVGKTQVLALLKAFFKSLLLSALMAAVIYMAYSQLGLLLQSSWLRAFGLLALVSLGVVTYIGGAWLFKVKEVHLILKLIKK